MHEALFVASQGRVLLFLFRLLGGGIGALLLVRHREGLDDLVEMGQLPVLAREVRVGVAPVNPRFFHHLVVLPAHLLRVQVFAREDGVILDHLIELQGRGGGSGGGGSGARGEPFKFNKAKYLLAYHFKLAGLLPMGHSTTSSNTEVSKRSWVCSWFLLVLRAASTGISDSLTVLSHAWAAESEGHLITGRVEAAERSAGMGEFERKV